jgi:hypothetical protein
MLRMESMQRTSCAVIFVGCATTAPDGSSPRGYVRLLVAVHRLVLLWHHPRTYSTWAMDLRVWIIAVDSIGGPDKVARCS